jgi:Tfp pilus assembly protein PilE
MWKEILMTVGISIPYALLAIYDLDCTFYGSCNIYGWLKGLYIILTLIAIVVFVIISMVDGKAYTDVYNSFSDTVASSTQKVLGSTYSEQADNSEQNDTAAKPDTDTTTTNKDTSSKTAAQQSNYLASTSSQETLVTSTNNDVTYTPIKSSDTGNATAGSDNKIPVIRPPVPSATATLNSAGSAQNVDTTGYMLLSSYNSPDGSEGSNDLNPHTQ